MADSAVARGDSYVFELDVHIVFGCVAREGGGLVYACFWGGGCLDREGGLRGEVWEEGQRGEKGGPSISLPR